MADLKGITILEEWHDPDQAGYEVELPDGRRLLFTAELDDCRDPYAYIEATLSEVKR